MNGISKTCGFRSIRPRMRHVLSLGLLATVAGSTGSWSQDSQSVIDPTFELGVGDVITVAVWKDPDLSSSVPVRPDGLVSLPLIGEVRAAGKTPDALRKEVEERMGQFVKAPTVSVVVTEIKSLMVYVLGEVGRPGAFELTRPLRLMQLLAMAGGLTEYAKKDQVVVLRAQGRDETRLVVSFKDVSSGKALDTNIWLDPGDTVIVP